MRGAFPGHFRPTTEEFDRLWGQGIFVVDTNVLLHLYRYSRSTRDELLEVLRALEDKLFLPHQVGQEFLDRRLTTIRTQREGFSRLRRRVTGVRGEMESELRKVLRLRDGEDLPEGLREALEEVPSGGYEALSERLEALEKDLPRASNSPDDDEVWATVERLVEGNVGPPYQDDEMRKAKEEAERRRNAKIPPGFKDERPGDYVLWRQTIDEAKRSVRPVVLVTDDRKEDWWWIVQGETIGPHPELITEMRKEAGVTFYMYTPDRLMSEARERLDVQVSDESISEAEGLGRETGKDATIDPSEPQTLFTEFLETLHSLNEDEKFALWMFQESGYNDSGSIANVLGITNFEADRLLDRAIEKMQVEISNRYQPPRERRDLRWSTVRREIGRREQRAEGDIEVGKGAYAQPISTADVAELLYHVRRMAPADVHARLRHVREEDLAALLNSHGYDKSLTGYPRNVIYDVVTRLAPFADDRAR